MHYMHKSQCNIRMWLSDFIHMFVSLADYALYMYMQMNETRTLSSVSCQPCIRGPDEIPVQVRGISLYWDEAAQDR